MTKNDYGAGVFPVGHKHFRLQVHVAARRPSTLNADIQPGSLSTCVQEPGAGSCASQPPSTGEAPLLLLSHSNTNLQVTPFIFCSVTCRAAFCHVQ